MSLDNIRYINIHTHQKPRLPGEYVIRNAYLPAKPNFSKDVAYPISVGLHPWHYDNMSLQLCKQLLTMHIQNKMVIAIGETGLDGLINMPLQNQKAYFQLHVELAIEFNKPIIVHAVKTYNQFVPYLQERGLKLIFHGFSGNIQTAEMLLRGASYFSFGKQLLKQKSIETFKLLPAEFCFLETDNQTQLNIRDIYSKAAEIKQCSIEQVQLNCRHNFKKAFGFDALFV